MKSLKRIAIVMLVLCCMTSLFAQGASEAKTSGPRIVTFWSLFTGGDGEFFDAIIDEFNKTHTDIQLKNDTVKFDDYYTKLTAAFAAGNAPDMIVCHQGNLLNYVPSGQLLALDEYLKANNFPVSDFVAAPYDACRFNGKQYAIPLDVHPIIMYVNMDLLEKAGIKEIPQTMDELIADGLKIQEKTGKMGIDIDNTTAVYKAYTLTRLFFSFIYQQGGTFLTADNKAANFNNQYGYKALQALQDMVQKYKTTPAGLDYDTAMNEFKLGDAAFYFNGVWATGTLEQQAGLNFIAIPVPGFMGKPAAWSGSHTLAIPAKANIDPEHVKDILTAIDFITGHGEMWAKAGHVPTRISVQNSKAFADLPYRKGYADSAASAVAPPTTAAWDEIYGTCSDLLEYAVVNGQPIQEALDLMETTVNKIIATY